MNQNRNRPFVIVPLLVFLVACSTESRGALATATLEPKMSTANAAYSFTQLAIEAQATAEARVTAAFQATEAQAIDVAEQMALQETATSGAITSATAQAQPMSERIKELHTSGVLSTSTGTYHPLPDFDASWAQINHYDFLLTELAPANFLLSTKVSWESASEIANWRNSGCGFVFRMNARGDHYLAYLGLDGWFYLYRNLDHSITLIGKGYFEQIEIPQGSAELMLVVEGDWITLFVNGEQVQRLQESTFSSGLLGYALISGTNKDFGTHCQMSNTDLWKIELP